MTDKSFEDGGGQDPLQSLDFPCPDVEMPVEGLDISYGDSVGRNCKSNVIDGLCRVICDSISESSSDDSIELETPTPINKFLVECEGKDSAGKCGAIITRFALDGSALPKKTAIKILEEMEAQQSSQGDS